MDVTINNVDNSGVRLTAVAEQIDCHPITEVKSCVCTNVKYRVVQQLLCESIISRAARRLTIKIINILFSRISRYTIFQSLIKLYICFFFPLPSVVYNDTLFVQRLYLFATKMYPRGL